MAEIPQQRFVPSGASQSSVNLANRLESFKNKFLGLAHDENVRLGIEQAKTVELVDEDGTNITDAPQFQPNWFFSSVYNKSYNKALQEGYAASLRNDIRGQMGLFKEEFSDDVVGYKSKVEGFRKALAKETDPLVRRDALLDLDRRYAEDYARVITKDRERRTVEAFNESQADADAWGARVRHFAQAGDVAGAADALTGQLGVLQRQVDAGLITKPEFQVKTRAAHAQYHEDILAGEVNRLALSGKAVEAWKRIQVFRTQSNPWLTIEERDEIADTLLKLVDENESIQDKIDAAELETLKEAQKEKSIELWNGVQEGTTTPATIRAALRNGELTQDQAENLYKDLSTEGAGAINYDVVISFEERIRKNEDVREEIKQTSPLELNKREKLRLIRLNSSRIEAQAQKTSAVGPKHYSKSHGYKRAEKYISIVTKVFNRFGNPSKKDQRARARAFERLEEGAVEIAESDAPNKDELYVELAREIGNIEERRQDLLPYDKAFGDTPQKALAAIHKLGRKLEAGGMSREKIFEKYEEQLTRIDEAIRLQGAEEELNRSTR